MANGTSARRVCVLGAGIVGLAAARALQEAGHIVTVVDRAQPGSGASGANGAQLSYAHVQPLAGPGIWRALPGLLFSPASPLKLKPRWDVHQWRWGLSFLGACTAEASALTTLRLLELAAESREAFDLLRESQRIDCDFRANGKLVLYRDARGLAAARAQLVLQRGLGVDQWEAGAQECRTLEPALLQDTGPLAGGVYTPSECVADCLLVCRELERLLRAGGAAFVLDEAATGIVQRGRLAVAVRTAQREIETDTVVVAMGSASARFARTLGIGLPVYPLKGYSITAPAREGHAPSVSITDAARKLVFARVGDRLRVAGLAELGGTPGEIPPAYDARLRREAAEVFPLAADYTRSQSWSGLRPATPDGLPLLGARRHGPANVIFNTGHGALGFTLAFGSARRLVRLLEADRPRLMSLTPAAAAPAPCSA